MFGKKFTAVIAATSICFSCVLSVFATGQYYITNEYPSLSANALEYTPTDTERVDELISSLASIIDIQGYEDEITDITHELYSLFVSAMDNCSLARLQYDKEFSEENRKALVNAGNDALTVQEKFYEAVKLIYYSEYVYILNDMFGEENIKDIIETAPNERYYELTKQEEELISKYEAVYGNGEACAELYSELVKVRNEIANEVGYDNYADFANEKIYYRDYSDEEINEFSEGVIEYYFPLLQSLLWIVNEAEVDQMPMSEAEVISSVDWLIDNINYELAISFRYMIENGLYDISFSDKKAQSGGAYTLYLNKIKAPYIFMSPYVNYEADSSGSLKTLIHESGHYAALLNDPANYENKYILNNYIIVDTAEVHSQGIEMLSMPYYGRLFGSNASEERLTQIALTVSAVVDGMMMHEFQTRVYESENTSTEAINNIAAEVINKYYGVECSPEEAQTIWTAVPHTFNAPMYYLAYAVSGAAALGILAESEKNYEIALDKYMRLSASGVRVAFNEAMELCGLGNILSVESITETGRTICDLLGILYEDIDYEAWYINYVYDVADIFEGRSATEFEPDNNITRGEFVETIGKMYEYYVGDDMNYATTFDDVDESDESAKYIAWASNNGIVEGYSDAEFGANDEITREQLVTVMHRLSLYEDKVYCDLSEDVKNFTDYSEIADWAKDPMSWAVDSEILNGRDNNMLVPQGNTTRAEAAKIISCYIDMSY